MKRKIKMISIILGVMLLTSIASVYAVQAVNSIDVSYDNTTSGLSSSNVKGAIDELYKRQNDMFSKIYLLAYLRMLPNSDTVLQDDGTSDHNMRYVGANPNNWVTFNGEKWRIIGVFNESSHGQVTDLVKITKNTNDGNRAWSSTGTTDWTTSSLKDYLNGEYYSSLSENAQKMIQQVTWKIGAKPWNTSHPNKNFYDAERGTTGSLSAPTIYIWDDPGKIALPYPSDIANSTAGGSTSEYSRTNCLDAATFITNSPYWATTTPMGTCAVNSWMTQFAYADTEHVYLLTAESARSNVYILHYNWHSGIIGYSSTTTTAHAVHPTLYLRPAVVCTNCGDSAAGTETNPYTLDYSGS